MKTKIIYISGNEVFDMRDIRAAFDEVRGALNLGGDTVLFGVPVDTDDALGAAHAQTTTTPATDEVSDPDMTVESDIIPDAVMVQETAEPLAETVVPPETMPDVTPEPVDIDVADDVPAPAPKRRRTSRKTRAETVTESTEPTPDIASDTPAESVAATDDASDKVIPILSILAAQKNDTPTDAVAGATDDHGPADDASILDDAPVAEISPISDTDTDDIESVPTDAEKVTIEDMITDDAPVADVEKTLEQLLEKMTPLREDHPEDLSSDAPDSAPTAPIIDDAMDEPDAPDSDATLTQLANEFAENQDTIGDAPQTHGGKIGKLKNILPFKKAKREDPGLMGDLFGWAGIAANDDEFSIPGFFTNAAAKK